MRIENGDILEVDIKNIVGAPTFKVAANLPYYITTPIIFNLLEQRLPMERLVAMVQKEVAERMVAKPGGKDYGALSVSIQYYTEPEIAFIVPPASFIPAPNVDSAVIVCKRRTVPPVEVCDEKLFFKVVKAAFPYAVKCSVTLSKYGHQQRTGCGMVGTCRYRPQAPGRNAVAGRFCQPDQLL